MVHRRPVVADRRVAEGHWAELVRELPTACLAARRAVPAQNLVQGLTGRDEQGIWAWPEDIHRAAVILARQMALPDAATRAWLQIPSVLGQLSQDASEREAFVRHRVAHRAGQRAFRLELSRAVPCKEQRVSEAQSQRQAVLSQS